MRLRTKLLLLSGSVVILVGSHYLWFRLFGPPYFWGTDTRVKQPLTSDSAEIDLAPYRMAIELERTRSDSRPSLPSPPDTVIGTPVCADSSPSCDLEVLQTRAGPGGGDDQHLYFRSARRPQWIEAPVVSRLAAFHPTVVCQDGMPSILLTSWNSWWPYNESYPRFLLSIFDRPLRSETGIYQLDIERHRLRFLFPGARIVPSPNRRQVAYLTSENRFRGFHNILVYDVASERSLRVLSLWEADPGSGTSFSYRWSYDSKALLITGRAGGWASHSDHATELQLVYFPDAEQLFDLAPRRN